MTIIANQQSDFSKATCIRSGFPQQVVPIILNDHARKIWSAGVAAVNAENRVREFVSVTPTELRFGEIGVSHAEYRNLVVVGAGKASGAMAAGLEHVLGDDYLRQKNVSGLINVPDDKVVRLKRIQLVGCRPAGINLPTDRVLASTENIIKMLAGCDPHDLCVVLIAGGGSALLEKPLPPITLAEFQRVTQLLSHRGAAIEELNAVRRRISAVKGGGLATLANCRRMMTLLISDVLGDPLKIIASGPTVIEKQPLDSTTNTELALSVLRKFDPDLSAVPTSVIEVLRNRAADVVANTPAIDTQVEHFIIGNNQMAVAAARNCAIELGYDCEYETDFSTETAEVVARRLVNWLRNQQHGNASPAKRCLISGGEPTMQLSKNPGNGGRNQHLVLTAMAEMLMDQPIAGCRFCLLSGGTDGEDGNVPIAGALFDEKKIVALRALDHGDWLGQVVQHLNRHNSHPLLSELGCLLKTAPTDTNVCDMRVVLWDRVAQP